MKAFIGLLVFGFVAASGSSALAEENLAEAIPVFTVKKEEKVASRARQEMDQAQKKAQDTAQEAIDWTLGSGVTGVSW